MPSAITLRDNGFADKWKAADVFNATTGDSYRDAKGVSVIFSNNFYKLPKIVFLLTANPKH